MSDLSKKKIELKMTTSYRSFVEELKNKIQKSQIKAALSVNQELIELYWDIGKSIVKKQDLEGWGENVIERIGEDLQKEFPAVKGFSSRNIWRMRSFYIAYTEGFKESGLKEEEKQKLPQLVAEIPWGHNSLIIQKIKEPNARLWYLQKTIQHGWSRAVLDHQIDSKLYERQGISEKSTNFEITLPKSDSDLATQLLKDPYNFDFLTLGDQFKEQELHRGIVQHLQKFLLELGVGFSFLGSNYHLQVGGDDYYIDLLFYHVKLRCYVVIELKAVEFKPEYVGKLNFYLSAADDLLRHPDDKPSIGLLLCKGKNHVTAEYALRGIGKPMGVSTYQTSQLPKELVESLPSIEEIESKLSIPQIEEDEVNE